MERSRLIIAVVLTVVVVGLTGWQFVREWRVSACIAAGGAWDGQTSRCVPLRPGPILERENLRRS